MDIFQPIDDDLNFKKKVEDVLEEAKASDKRARMMDIDDFMRYVIKFSFPLF